MNKNAKKSKQLQSIKKKLTAATAMLLVASTMMVSSTYAWFTLSTAPEVTGISTTVGANGSLEIALASGTTTDGGTIRSGDGDSIAATGDVTISNETWGNLVDLGNDAYGLQDIVLYPAQINAIANVVQDEPLSTPQYGVDGRVSGLSANTTYATYKEGKWSTENVGYGVRAIGALSGQSETTITFNKALAQVKKDASSAQFAARAALETNGDKLGNIVIKQVLNDNPTITAAEFNALGDMIDGLQDSLDIIGGTLKSAALARSASNEFSDTVKYDYLTKAIAEKADDGVTDKYTVEQILKMFYGTQEEKDGTITSTDGIISTTDSLGKAFTAYTTAQTKVSEAKDEFDTTKKADANATYTWEEAKAIVEDLMNMSATDKVLVNGHKISEAMNNIAAIMSAGVQVQLKSGSGVIADIADIAGDFSASITFDENAGSVDLGGAGSVSLEGVTATMVTISDLKPNYHLTVTYNDISAKGAMTSGEGGNTNGTFSDTYAYVIDLFFRTNATSSNLMLQTTPVDRVYEDQVDGTTMGSGSTIAFTTKDVTKFSVKQMRDLMNCIKLVFMDSEGTILAHGKLVAPGEDPTPNADNSVTLEGNVYLLDAADQMIGTESAAITSLAANEPKMVSVMVYLDGTMVDNSMVANDYTSMEGTLNLQFSSSAELIPMENNQIKEIGQNDTEAETFTITKSVVEGVQVGKLEATGVTAADKAAAGDTVAIYVPNTVTSPTVTVSDGEATITTTTVTNENITDGVVYTFEMPAKAVTVTVEAGATS